MLSIFCLLLLLNIGILLLGIPEIFLESRHRSLITLILFLIQEAVFFAPLHFFIIKKYRLRPTQLGWKWIPLRESIKWILQGFGLLILFNIIFVFLTEQFSALPPGFNEQEAHIPFFGNSAFDIALAVLVLVIIAPFIEELLFRGFLLQTFAARMKPFYASLLTAFIFAAVHFEFQSIGIIFVVSLILNWIFLRSGSVIPAIGFHMANNALAFLVEWFVLK